MLDRLIVQGKLGVWISFKCEILLNFKYFNELKDNTVPAFPAGCGPGAAGLVSGLLGVHPTSSVSFLVLSQHLSVSETILFPFAVCFFYIN